METIYSGQSFHNGILLSNQRFTVRGKYFVESNKLAFVTQKLMKAPTGSRRKRSFLSHLLIGILTFAIVLLVIVCACIIAIIQPKKLKLAFVMLLDFMMLFFVHHAGTYFGYSYLEILAGSFIFSLLYIFVVALLDIKNFKLLDKDKQLSQYHASEHMVINAVEAGVPLTTSHVRACSRIHRRCGTNQMVLKVILFPFAYVLTTFVFGLPSIAISYVVSNLISQALFSISFLEKIPVLGLTITLGNLWQKYVTTTPPTDHHLRVGIAVMKELQQTTDENLTGLVKWRSLG